MDGNRHWRRRGLRSRLLGSVVLGGSLALTAGCPASAQSASGSVTALDDITVTAERQESSINNSSGTVSVKKAGDLERHLVKKPQDLVADEPGVNISQKPNRTGATNYAIRGLTDNRVKLLIDGIPVPDYPGVLSSNAGAGLGPGSYTRDVIDFDSLKQVEIVRGPASALYGSDAIGGVVGFVTKDPEDFLKIFDKNWYLGAKAAYDSADRSFTTTETIAGKAGPWSAMVLATARWGRELRPNTDIAQSAYTNTVVNPQDIFQGNLLSKLIYDTPDAGRWRLTVERFRKDVDTDIQSDHSGTILESRGQDVTDRTRVSIDWSADIDTTLADKVKAKIYYTGVERTDETDQLRSAGTVTRWRKDDFTQDIVGAEAQLAKAFDWYGLHHNLTYGATINVTRTERLSEGIQTTNGVPTSTFGGDTYPLKRFPDTKTVNAGLYVQDVAAVGAWRFIPAMRIDYWSLRPDADALYSGATVGDQTEVSFSPKFGVTYDLTETYRLFAQYAHGFRAPPYDAVNYGFTNSAAFYRILPNTNLVPESSNGFEGGIRGRFEGGSSIQLSGFYNIYKNFITLVDVPNQSIYDDYQHVNLDKVRIWGIEAKGEWRIRPDWSLYGSAAYANGRDMQTGAAIDTVDPLTGVLGARWKPADMWSLEARIKGVAGKHDVSSTTVVETEAYSVTDVFAGFEPSKHVVLNAGVLNVFDKSYFNPADVAGLSNTNPTALERYRAPGRSFAASLTVRF